MGGAGPGVRAWRPGPSSGLRHAGSQLAGSNHPPSRAGETWWRDGGSNFTVPVPGARAQKAEDSALRFEDELRWVGAGRGGAV